MSNKSARLQEISKAIGTFPDFPKKGILFRDIFGVFRNPALTRDLLDELISLIKQRVLNSQPKIDAIVGLDARGFLFGPPLACELNCSFVPVRKAGKLPGKCYAATYSLEYGQSTFELQQDALKAGDKVVLVDDLLATSGSLRATVELIKKAGATSVAAVVVMELGDLHGREQLEAIEVPVYSLLTF